MSLQIGLLILMIFFVIYFSWEAERMDSGPRTPLESHLDTIKAKEKKCIKTYAKSMRNGIIRGCLGGLLMGNYEGMVDGAVTYGILNPIFKYLE